MEILRARAPATCNETCKRKCVSSKIYTTEDRLTLERSRWPSYRFELASSYTGWLWFPSNCPGQRRDHRLRRCRAAVQEFTKDFRRFFDFLNGTIVRGLKMRARRKESERGKSVWERRRFKMKFSIESGYCNLENSKLEEKRRRRKKINQR